MPATPPPIDPPLLRRPALRPRTAPSASPTAVRVRRANLDDLDDLVALEQRSFASDRLSRTQYRRHLDSASAQVLVARTEPRACLGAAVLFFRKGSAAARLYSLASQPDARGIGVGSALLDAAESAARQRRCRSMRLEVRTANAAAIRLYEQHGYRRIGHCAGYYEDGADAWRYEKTFG